MTNNQNKVFQPIFYKGTTFANYEEATHVLSSNNCVLMDDLFGIRSKQANSEALVANQLDDEIGVDSEDIELYEESGVQNETYRTSHVDNLEDQFNFEGSTADIHSPIQIQNPTELSRYLVN